MNKLIITGFILTGLIFCSQTPSHANYDCGMNTLTTVIDNIGQHMNPEATLTQSAPATFPSDLSRVDVGLLSFENVKASTIPFRGSFSGASLNMTSHHPTHQAPLDIMYEGKTSNLNVEVFSSGRWRPVTLRNEGDLTLHLLRSNGKTEVTYNLTASIDYNLALSGQFISSDTDFAESCNPTPDDSPIVCIEGDTNADGTFNWADLWFLFQHVNNPKNLSPEQECGADMNKDGKITYSDAMYIYYTLQFGQ